MSLKSKKPLEIQNFKLFLFRNTFITCKAGPKNIWNQKNLKIDKICELRSMIPILAWACLGRGEGVAFESLNTYNFRKTKILDILIQKVTFLIISDKIYAVK